MTLTHPAACSHPRCGRLIPDEGSLYFGRINCLPYCSHLCRQRDVRRRIQLKRGLLCSNCNVFIGMAEEDIDRLRRAIVYLLEAGKEVLADGD